MMKNIEIWSIITTACIIMVICGMYVTPAILFTVVAIYDLRRLFRGKQTITGYCRKLLPAWADKIVLGAAWAAAFYFGGWQMLVAIVAGTILGHILWNE